MFYPYFLVAPIYKVWTKGMGFLKGLIVSNFIAYLVEPSISRNYATSRCETSKILLMLIGIITLS
jgi:hypothetical protein